MSAERLSPLVSAVLLVTEWPILLKEVLSWPHVHRVDLGTYELTLLHLTPGMSPDLSTLSDYLTSPLWLDITGALPWDGARELDYENERRLIEQHIVSLALGLSVPSRSCLLSGFYTTPLAGVPHLCVGIGYFVSAVLNDSGMRRK